jgi:hypothetical protein
MEEVAVGRGRRPEAGGGLGVQFGQGGRAKWNDGRCQRSSGTKSTCSKQPELITRAHIPRYTDT